MVLDNPYMRDEDWRKENVAALHASATSHLQPRARARPASAGRSRGTRRQRPQSARPALATQSPSPGATPATSARRSTGRSRRPASASAKPARGRGRAGRPASAGPGRRGGAGPTSNNDSISQVSQALARTVYTGSASPDGRRRRRPHSAAPRTPFTPEATPSSFQRSVARVKMLWEELRLPERDRDLFAHRYLRQQTPANEAALADHLRLLVAHRAATIKVLHLIRTREDRLSAVRAHLRDAAAPRDDASEQLDSEREAALTRLCHALLDLRKATVVLVEAVQEWRRHLSRPKPFLWRSVNYAQKVGTDAQFLVATDAALGVLRELGLAPSALPVLLPTLPRALAREEEELRRAKFFKVDADGLSAYSLVPELELDALPGAERERLLRVARLIVDEPAVQQRVDREMRELAARNLVVPTLAWTPEEEEPPAREVPRSARSQAREASTKQTRLRLRRELESARRFGAESAAAQAPAGGLPRPGAPTPLLVESGPGSGPGPAPGSGFGGIVRSASSRRHETALLKRSGSGGAGSARALLRGAVTAVSTPCGAGGRSAAHPVLRPSGDDPGEQAIDPSATYDTPMPVIKCHLQLPVDDHTVEVGSDVLLTGRPPLRSGANPVARPKAHQWFKDGVLLPGATNSSMLLAAAAVEDTGLYMCQVTYHTGDLATSEYMLRVVDSGAVALQCAVTVLVKDAASNDVLPSAVVNVVDGGGVTEAGAPSGRLLAKVPTAADGTAVVRPVASWVGRPLRLYASQSGYAGASIPLQLRSAADADRQVVLCPSPFTSPGKVRLVLTWDAEPQALDLRVLCPSGAVVRFSEQASREDNVYLERDISNGFGPQTVIMEAPGGCDGWYRVVVCPAPRNGAVRASRASLAVVDPRGLLRVFELPQFAVPDADEDQTAERDRMLWDVCAVHGRTGEVLGCSRLAADVPAPELAVPALLNAAAWAAAPGAGPRCLAELLRMVPSSSSGSSRGGSDAESDGDSYSDDDFESDSDSGSELRVGGEPDGDVVSFEQLWKAVQAHNVPLSEADVVALLDVLEPAEFSAVGQQIGTLARLRPALMDGEHSD